MSAPAILCPVDFSEASRGALRYAAALAQHFRARLVVMTATDPLLAEAAAFKTSADAFEAATRDALERFAAEAFDDGQAGEAMSFEAAVGEADAEILRTARARRIALIVMSSHGLTGFRKMFFGSTTERVLRETGVPVLIVSGDDRGPISLAQLSRQVRRILLPVPLAGPAGPALEVARGIAAAVQAPVLLLHVVEPLRSVLTHGEPYLATVERERRLRAETALERIAGEQSGASIETLLSYGEPSEEIVKVARDRRVGVIVMGLQSSREGGRRIGSVTYRVLSAAGCPVLALPASLRVRAHGTRAGNFSRNAKKAARGGRSTTNKNADSLSKSANTASGTARALRDRRKDA